jgi:hypothetical protein
LVTTIDDTRDVRLLLAGDLSTLFLRQTQRFQYRRDLVAKMGLHPKLFGVFDPLVCEEITTATVYDLIIVHGLYRTTSLNLAHGHTPFGLRENFFSNAPFRACLASKAFFKASWFCL